MPRGVRPSKGTQTTDSESYVIPQRVREATGGKYSPDSGVLGKALGRTEYNAALITGSSVSIAALNFNQATDQIYVQRDSIIQIGPATDTGSFTNLERQAIGGTADVDVTTSAPASATPITTARLGDAYIIANGAERPVLVENNLKGRILGLLPAQSSITFANPTAVAATFPDGSSTTLSGDTFTKDLAKAFDGNKDTKAQVYAADGGSAQVTYTNSSSVSSSSHFVVLDFRFDPSSSEDAKIKIFLSTDAGVTYTKIFQKDKGTGRRTLQKSLTDAITLSNIRVRFKVEASLFHNGELKIWGISFQTGAVAGTFSTANKGIRYLSTEYYDYTRELPSGQTVTWEVESSFSPMSPPFSSAALTFASWNGVTLTFDGNTVNSLATQRRIYRSIDGETIDATRAIDNFTVIGEIPIDDTVFVDRIDAAGLPLDYLNPQEAPPFVTKGQQVFHKNSPPRADTDVVGAFAGSVTYASPSEEGIWRYSEPIFPDYVPDIYAGRLPGKATAFADIGVHVVFTPQSVNIYPFLPLTSDTDFQVDRTKSLISLTHGSVSRRGTAVFQTSNGTILVGFIAGDGVYATGGSELSRLVRVLDWPNTVKISSLASAELWNDPQDRRLILVADDPDDNRKAWDIYYDRGDSIDITGPRPWPSGGSAVLIKTTGELALYTQQSGRVYKEKNGTNDAAELEGTNGKMVWRIKSPRIYPFEGRGKGRLQEVHFDIDALIGGSATVTVTTRIDSGTERTTTSTDSPSGLFSLTKGGWKTFHVDKECESFQVTLESSDPDFPGLNAWSASTDKSDDIFALS